MEKQILHYKDYTVDENWNIYSYKTGSKQQIKPWLDSRGRYCMIGLSEKGEITKYLVHRLVAMTFIPNPDNLPEVDHIDHNPQNNQVSNLRWVTHQTNIHHSYETMGQVRNYVVVHMYYQEEYIGTFKSKKLACRYAEKKYGTSFSSLEKYGHSGNVRIERIGVTTIENFKIIESLDEVE